MMVGEAASTISSHLKQCLIRVAKLVSKLENIAYCRPREKKFAHVEYAESLRGFIGGGGASRYA